MDQGADVFDYIYTVENAWILSRTRSLDAKMVEDLKKTLADADIDTEKFILSDQSSCD